MNLLIRTINQSTSRKDLRAFVNRVLKSWFRLPFSAAPRIVSCRILAANDFTGQERRHGLIDVTPDDAAWRVIRKLNGGYLKGKRVKVTEYQQASTKSSQLPLS